MYDVLDQARNQYDLIVCDCPPGLSLLAEAAIASADIIVVPQVPDRLSTQGLQLYAKYLKEDLELSNVAERTAVFINMMDHRTGVASEYADAIRREAGNAKFPYRVFAAQYNDAVAYKRAMERSRRLPFSEVYAGVEGTVLAATRELWTMLGWIED
jgi:cellulose biosynthesis protein BcsQ